jgi:hypothetical protein
MRKATSERGILKYGDNERGFNAFRSGAGLSTSLLAFSGSFSYTHAKIGDLHPRTCAEGEEDRRP